jgi:hypothetical protein
MAIVVGGSYVEDNLPLARIFAHKSLLRQKTSLNQKVIDSIMLKEYFPGQFLFATGFIRICPEQPVNYLSRTFKSTNVTFNPKEVGRGTQTNNNRRRSRCSAGDRSYIQVPQISSAT